MNIHVICPVCQNRVDLDVCIEDLPPGRWRASKFVCPKCGEENILSLSCCIKNDPLPQGIKDKIDRLTDRPEIVSVGDQPVVWISNKLGFLRPQEKCHRS